MYLVQVGVVSPTVGTPNSVDMRSAALISPSRYLRVAIPALINIVVNLILSLPAQPRNSDHAP